MPVRLSTGAPAGYLDPYPWVFKCQNPYPDPQRFFPTDHLDPQVRNPRVAGFHRSPVVNKNTMSMALSPNRKSVNEVESGAFSGWRWPGNADHILTQLCRWCEQSEITGTTQRAVGLTKAQERDASRLSMVSVKYIYRPESIIEEREGILPWTSHASPNHFIGGGEVSPVRMFIVMMLWGPI